MSACRPRRPGLPATLSADRLGRIALRAAGGREFDDPDIVATIRQLLNL
ncbi:MAG: hypothetical protein Q8O52_21370 [Sulfuritalea sp.]|nr:hypothetical protein [Sulfuritalea sp.]